MIRFLDLYDHVFNEDGTVKLCGRNMCQELILLADQAEKGVTHGNLNSCMMDIEAMHRLKEKADKIMG